MKPLDYYLELFSRLRRSSGPMWSEATGRQAPHKPVLLLSVLDMVARGQLSSNYIDLSGDLIELNDLFNSYWIRVVSPGQTSSIAFPFSRLHNEDFWKLVPILSSDTNFAWISTISNVSQLQTRALGAEIDEDLFQYMQNAGQRNSLRQVLLYSYFSEEARQALEDQAMINAEAYSYSLELLEKSHASIVSDIIKQKDYKPEPVRDQGFRRAVVKTYDQRCAICGVRMITPDGHTAVEAAHIIPWSKSHNDDIRNGMALCGLCHWSFDEGFIGVSADYDVLVSLQLGVSPNLPGLLLTLKGRSIIFPADKELRPAQDYLNWHRSTFKLDKF